MKKHLKLICVIGFFVLLAALLPVFLHLSGNKAQETDYSGINSGAGTEDGTMPGGISSENDTTGETDAGETTVTPDTGGFTTNTDGSSGTQNTDNTSNAGDSIGTANTGGSTGTSNTSDPPDVGGVPGTHKPAGSTGTTNTGGSAETPGETPSQPPTLHQQNQAVIQQIYNTYGYSVSYNEESFYYHGEATPLTDEEVAADALSTISRASALLPSGFFRTLQGENGYRIILVSDLDGAAGVTSYEFGNDNVIALDANTTFLSRVFFHETWHVMEKYIWWQNRSAFDSWGSLNPAGFAYGADSSNRYTILTGVGTYADIDSEVSFVSLYAKEAPQEDRAELFADLMFRAYKRDYMAAGFGVNNKAIALANILRTYFPNSAGARWESWITF